MVQFRNSLMNQRVLHLFSKRKGLPEILSGSDFHPDASWIPPGRKLINEYLGDIAASNKLHLNIFDELISQNPRDRYNKIIVSVNFIHMYIFLGIYNDFILFSGYDS